MEQARSFQLTEENVLLAARAVLPIANSFISVAQVIFSGDPSMTLKVSYISFLAILEKVLRFSLNISEVSDS